MRSCYVASLLSKQFHRPVRRIRWVHGARQEVAAHRQRTALDADGVREAVQDARLVADELASLIVRLERSSALQSGAAAPAARSAEPL